jgi:hypothetical protein
MTQRRPSKCIICREPMYSTHKHPSGSCYSCADDLRDLVRDNFKASLARQEAFAEFVANKYEVFSTIAPAAAAAAAAAPTAAAAACWGAATSCSQRRGLPTRCLGRGLCHGNRRGGLFVLLAWSHPSATQWLVSGPSQAHISTTAARSVCQLRAGRAHPAIALVHPLRCRFAVSTTIGQSCSSFGALEATRRWGSPLSGRTRSASTPPSCP